MPAPKAPRRKRASFLWSLDLKLQVQHDALDAKMPLDTYLEHIVSEWTKARAKAVATSSPRLPRAVRSKPTRAEQPQLPGIERDINVHRLTAAPQRVLHLPELDYEASWLLRLLWSLEWARRNNLPPQRASQLTGILTAHGRQNVHRENTARKFRDLRALGQHQDCWREVDGQRYAITPAGQALLFSLLGQQVANADQSVAAAESVRSA